MRNVVPILCCVFLLIGGSMLLAPAEQVGQVGQIIEVPVSYEVVLPVYPDTNGIAAPVDQLAALTRPAAAGGCSGGVCPLGPALKKSVPTDNSATAAVEEGDGSRQPLRAVAGGVVRVVRAVVGIERRQARRASRRGE